MQLGETFVMGTGGHLWIVISDPVAHPECIIVNITSDVFRAGKECELGPGDHPFITDKSYISFGDAKKVTPEAEAKLQQCVESGLVTRHAVMRRSVLDRIVAAGKVSKALRTEYRAYL